jgi:hypothetical protein
MVGKTIISVIFAVTLAAAPALAQEAEEPRARKETCAEVIVIDPEWPHDQAMVADHDWPHDRAMIVPHAEEGEETVPLFDELLGAIEQDVRESKVRQLLEDWLPGKSK